MTPTTPHSGCPSAADLVGSGKSNTSEHRGAIPEVLMSTVALPGARQSTTLADDEPDPSPHLQLSGIISGLFDHFQGAESAQKCTSTSRAASLRGSGTLISAHIRRGSIIKKKLALRSAQKFC